MIEKYAAIPKDDTMLPKTLLLHLLTQWHNEFYDHLNVPRGEEIKNQFNHGVAEGFKRMIRFIESLEVNKVEKP